MLKSAISEPRSSLYKIPQELECNPTLWVPHKCHSRSQRGEECQKRRQLQNTWKIHIFLFNCFCETHQSPVLFSTLSTPMNQFVHSAERFCWFMFDIKYFTSVSFLDVWHHLDEVAVVSHHELVMLHHDGKGAVGDNDMCYNSSYLYGLKPLICKLMVE